MDYKAIVLAAGQGKRMKAGFNKQLIQLNGTPLIIHTLRLFEQDESCKEIILVISESEGDVIQSLIQRYGIQKVSHTVAGGAERQDSVYAGLQAISDGGIVLIHDGARPFVKSVVIQQLAKEAAQTGGAIAAVPVKDTIKKTEDGLIQQTVERVGLWAAQTPQAFLYEVIVKAHEEAKECGYYGTDDASLLERSGRPVTIVESDYLNIKLTTEEDLLFAETILQAKENGK